MLELNQRQRQRGSTLIVALGVLTLLSVLAVTFYQVMNLEMQASKNYVDGVKSVMGAKAGLARSIEELRRRASTSVVTDPNDAAAPWNYENGRFYIPLEESTAPSIAGTLGASYDEGVDAFRCKVIDTQAQINLNNNEETIGQILDHLGLAIAQLNPRAIANGRVNPIALARYGPWRGGEAIVEFRDALPGRTFSSKNQLKDIIPNEEALKILDPYVTTVSWLDPKAVRTVIRDPLRTPTEVEQPARTPDNPDEVRRAPINVNTAPIEVLASVIARVSGRSIYLEPGATNLQVTDDGTVWRNPFDQFEDLSYGLTPHLFYVEPIGWSISTSSGQPDISIAIEIARKVDEYRRGPQGPFDSYMELERFFDQLDTNLLPSATDARVPDTVKNRVDFQNYYKKCARSSLKANFNPNARISYFNPNKASFLDVDKGSLIYVPDLNNTATAQRTQTLEFCFGSKGVFEVTALGEIVGGPTNGNLIYAQAKLRTVVKLFDSITHTSQRDFERNDQEFLPDRTYVESYPENRVFWDFENPDDSGGDAHEYDGRVEIAPYNARADADGDRNDTEWAAYGRKLYENRFEERKVISGANGSPKDAFVADVANLVPFAGGTLTNFHKPFGSMVGPNKIGFVAKTFPWGLAYPDGIYSGEIQGRKGLLWFRSGFADPAGNPNPDLQGESALTTGNVLPTKGCVEFWYKPDFDWTVRDENDQLVTSTTGTGGPEPTERFCGLVHASHVFTNQVTNTKTRGTQFFLMRNTRGDLRVTRIYYEVVGEKGADLPPIQDPDPNDQWVVTDIESYKVAVENEPIPTNGAPPKYPWPPAEMQNVQAPIANIKHARTDAFVPYTELQFWRSHEWHHIAVYWDDEYAGNDQQELVKIYIDGRIVHTNHTMPRDAWTVEEDRLFSRLNEQAPISSMVAEKDKRPKDHVYVGGLSRLQSVQGGGIFKHTREVELPSNGTIDDVRFYDGTQPAPSSDLTPPERFLPGFCDYSNRFDLRDRFPPGAQILSLANVQFTAYLPTTYGRQLRPDGTGEVTVTLFVNGNPVGTHTFNTLGQRQDFAVTDASGLPIPVRLTDRVTYTVHMEAANFGDNLAVDTPILDDVTVTYFLPSAEIMLQERLFD